MIQHTLDLKRNYNDKINSLQFLEFLGKPLHRHCIEIKTERTKTIIRSRLIEKLTFKIVWGF